MFCASLLAGRPFWQMPYGAQPHRDEGCFASAIEMRWTGIMSVSSLKNHWSSYCSLLLFRFELRSLPWIRLADITRFRTQNLNWIERSRLFCYSVINLLFAFNAKAFLCYHINQRLSRTFFFFFKSFLHSSLRFYFLRNHFFFLKIGFLRNESYLTTEISFRQPLFSFFSKYFFWSFLSLLYCISMQKSITLKI